MRITSKARGGILGLSPDNFSFFNSYLYLCTRFRANRQPGEMVEWSITAVLKTAVLRGTGGSNPSLSANKRQVLTWRLFFFHRVCIIPRFFVNLQPYLTNKSIGGLIMAYRNKFTQSDDYRRDELIRIIEHSVEKLTLQELEALYYDMSTKNYINE